MSGVSGVREIWRLPGLSDPVMGVFAFFGGTVRLLDDGVLETELSRPGRSADLLVFCSLEDADLGGATGVCLAGARAFPSTIGGGGRPLLDPLTFACLRLEAS